jgi:hypothetical protein
MRSAPPSMTRSSPSIVTRPPSAFKPSATPASRSLSLWRSSPAPRMRVVPFAQIAARQRMGISSMAAATSAAEIPTARSRLERTVSSASGSPSPAQARSTGRSSMSAPIASRRSIALRRVGLTPTPTRVSSASGWQAPATSQKTAEERSPATRSSSGATVWPPRRLTTTPPGVAPSELSTETPRARSIRSVWSRVATGSRTAVVPSAARPASRMADLTWALGTVDV